MKTKYIQVLTMGAIALIPAYLPSVASAATVSVIHGINGKDLALAESLPVDISVNGACTLKGFTFRSIRRVELPAGTYKVKISPSNGSCSAAAVIDTSVKIAADQQTVALVAHLNEQSSPRLAAFDNSPSQAMVEEKKPLKLANFVYHTAATGQVQRGFNLYTGRPPFRGGSWYGGNPISSGEGGFLFGSFSPARYRVFMDAFTKRPGRPKTLTAVKGRLDTRYAHYMVGSQKSGFEFITEQLP